MNRLSIHQPESIKQSLARLQAVIAYQRTHSGPDDDLNAWDVLAILGQLVTDLVAVYGKPEEADEAARQ